VSIAVAIPFGVASAVVYGSSIVVQHRVVHRGGEEDARHLLRIVRDPVWLLAIGGDAIGFLLQIVALSTGPVVLVQPLVVLMLPVALVVTSLMGGTRPRPGDYLGCVAVIGGLAGFLGLVGRPGNGHVPHPHRIAWAILVVLVIVTVICVGVIGRRPVLRGAIYGAAAGACFGTLAVMVDAASDRVARAGVHGLLATPRGLVPLGGIVVLGLGGIVLTLISFQVGALAATLPANLAADPVTAVIFGVILLREHIPTGPAYFVGYVLCLAAIVAGAIRLAAPATAEVPERHASGRMGEN
jgi:drug/metabolite transporter (DMT)-like permease